MTKVKGPNGVVFNWPAELVESLVRDGSHELVKETPVVKVQPKAEPKSSK